MNLEEFARWFVIGSIYAGILIYRENRFRRTMRLQLTTTFRLMERVRTAIYLHIWSHNPTAHVPDVEQTYYNELLELSDDLLHLAGIYDTAGKECWTLSGKLRRCEKALEELTHKLKHIEDAEDNTP